MLVTLSAQFLGRSDSRPPPKQAEQFTRILSGPKPTLQSLDFGYCLRPEIICKSSRGSTYTTIRELGPVIPSIVRYFGPNSLIVVILRAAHRYILIIVQLLVSGGTNPTPTLPRLT